jgi:hypothetical protein
MTKPFNVADPSTWPAAFTLSSQGQVIVVTPKNGRDFSSREINKVVGGHFQVVPLHNGYQLWCNEEGKLMDLPVNKFATMFMRGWDVVVGDVLVCRDGMVE